MSCAGCTGCTGGCVEPTGGTPNSANCSPDAKSGYTICPWPSLTGTGCLPGGNCNQFGNTKACIKWVSADFWASAVRTVDCTTTYGFIVDIRWEMTIDGSGNVVLSLLAYLTGTTTPVVATIVTYSGTISLAACNAAFSLRISADGGQCGNWPCIIRVQPLCCVDCPSPPGCTDPCCYSPVLGKPAPPKAIVHGLLSPDTGTCPSCPAYDGSDWTVPFDSATCQWLVLSASVFCTTFVRAGVLMGYVPFYNAYQIFAIGDDGGGGAIFIVYSCPAASFSCDLGATNTFTRFSPAPSQVFLCDSSSTGAGWPNTITQGWSL